MKNQCSDRYVYVVFMVTATGVGKFIRIMTKHSYNHTSLSLYPDLRVFYTFARHHENTPFYGGFVKESLRRFPRDARTRIKVCRLRLTAEQYAALCDFLRPFLENPKEYVYNLLSAATTVGARRLKLSKSYTCVEFVTDALLASGYLESAPEFCPIKELEVLLEENVIYEGTVLGYPLPESWCGDTFPMKKGMIEGLQHTFFNIARLYFMFRKERKQRKA